MSRCTIFFCGKNHLATPDDRAVPISTAAVIPFCMSQSNSALTLAFQWSGTGIGVCHAYDVASSLKSGSHLSKIAGFFT